MRDNPIRKEKGYHFKPPQGGVGLYRPTRWYAICPNCGERVRYFNFVGQSVNSRKKAKDDLHRHLQRCTTTPGLVELPVRSPYPRRKPR